VLFTVCPTTTLHTTIWRDLHAPDHAIRRMIEAALRVAINTRRSVLLESGGTP
jgi:adenosine deaminase